MKTSPSEILHRIIEATQMTVKDFAISLDVSYDRMFSIYNGRTKRIALDIADKIVEKYGVERRFLLMGEGMMFSDQQQNISTNDMVNGLFTVLDSLRKENEALRARIAQLEEEAKNK